MFSKALFKQSCKANGTMWVIITFAVCFMLACVMLISGGGNISEVKNAIEDTIITEEINAQMEKRGVNLYNYGKDGMHHFDKTFAADATDALSYLTWLSKMPKAESFGGNNEQYAAAIAAWKGLEPKMQTEFGKNYKAYVEKDATKYANQQTAITEAYTAAALDLQSYMNAKAAAINPAYKPGTTEADEILGSAMCVLNPNGMFNDLYLKNEGKVSEDYDVTQIIAHIAAGDIAEYLKSDERDSYVSYRTEELTAQFLAAQLTNEDNVQLILDNLASYGVDKEKYDSFGYDYAGIKHLAKTAVITYKSRLSYEISLIAEKYPDVTSEEYKTAVTKKSEELAAEVTGSLLASLPDDVSEALQEVGQADLYTLIVGSIFYKLAGLLLPIIYMIMASNNLIAGQVDSGSMAYVLSTSTKRKTVVFTQALYLIGSLLLMFALTTATGMVCLAIVHDKVSLTYGKLALLNVGAFLILFALSGLCFFTSCYFDRSKRSMAIGGGLSIFALVAAMLGLFGSQVIPSVVRLDSLNYFNYVTIISLFDVVSIINSELTFLWKYAILLVAGVIGYLAGEIKFVKKDLPL